MSHPPMDVRTILSDAALEKLKAHYDLAFLLAATNHTLGAPFPPAAGWAEYITGTIYDESFLPAEQREIAVISTLIAEGSIGPLMVHFYWGLMSGLSAHQIGAIITIASTYSGVPRYTTVIRLFADTLHFLNDWVTAGRPLDSKSVCLAMLETSKQ